MKHILCAVLLMAVATLPSISQEVISIIPEPVSVKKGSGHYTLSPTTSIEIKTSDQALAPVAKYLAGQLAAPTGFDIQVKAVDAFSNGNIHLRLSQTPTGRKEGYKLNVSSSAIEIAADSAAGV